MDITPFFIDWDNLVYDFSFFLTKSFRDFKFLFNYHAVTSTPSIEICSVFVSDLILRKICPWFYYKKVFKDKKNCSQIFLGAKYLSKFDLETFYHPENYLDQKFFTTRTRTKFWPSNLFETKHFAFELLDVQRQLYLTLLFGLISLVWFVWVAMDPTSCWSFF